jgi:ferredoxin
MSFVLSVDAGRCMGHGRCYTVAPGLLSDDDEGFVTLRSGSGSGSVEVAEEQLAEARRAVTACPERAITLTETG